MHIYIYIYVESERECVCVCVCVCVRTLVKEIFIQNEKFRISYNRLVEIQYEIYQRKGWLRMECTQMHFHVKEGNTDKYVYVHGQAHIFNTYTYAFIIFKQKKERKDPQIKRRI